ncbi:MAG: saccharopine dehydrogenase NADP-binding domain-containing protein [Ignavibacteria bacterium]|nr:saccharopine dehydrogenase NADP-binding domain-containing protein [Ignavibacteria bacterium]
MARILVLGCGLVGKTIVKDLAKTYQVGVVDIDLQNLNQIQKFVDVQTFLGDATDKLFISPLLKDYDVVVSAVPGSIGFKVLNQLIEFEKNVVDISFFPENPFELDEIAKANSVTAIVDCGVAPGLSNIIVGYQNSKDKLASATIYVGGLPFERVLPFEYKAPFSPSDVIEEYLRVARIKSEGKIVQVQPLTELEHIYFPKVGTLEAFLTDGLRTLLFTTNIPNLKEKTLRYPGYAEKIKFLKDLGFFGTKPVKTKVGEYVPLYLTESILTPLWKLTPAENEFTAMRVVMKSSTSDKNYIYELFDQTDFAEQNSSMGRTTGFVATGITNLLIQGEIQQKGIVAPETLGENSKMFEFVVNYLRNRGIELKYNEDYLGTNI